MSHNRWHRHQEESLAVDELLDAAGRAFAEFGVAKATMIDVARIAGCSRATLYRYFPNQSSLHLAYVQRASIRINAQLADRPGAGRSETHADRILASIAAVRADPLLAVWFEPQNMAVPLQLIHEPGLLQLMSSGFFDRQGIQSTDSRERELRGEWLLRSIVSLLATPGRDADHERTIVEAFVIPVLATTATADRLPT